MSREKLSAAEIEQALAKLNGWIYRGNAIHRDVKLSSYRQGATWLAQIVELAEEQDHHPDMTLTYSNLAITLSTHDAGGVTGRDLEMAQKISAIVIQ